MNSTAHPPQSSFSKKRKEYIGFFGIIGAFITLVYAGINIYIADYVPAVLEIICGSMILLSIFLFTIKNNTKASVLVGSISVTFIAIYNFGSGGYSGTGIYWVFVLISVLFYINGSNGKWWAGFTFLTCLIISGFNYFGIYFNLPYTEFDILMFFLTLLTISILTYFYQDRIESGVQLVNKKNEELNEALKTIEEKNKQLEDSYVKLKEDTENIDKMNQLIIGREVKMAEMKERLKQNQISTSPGSNTLHY